MHKYLRAIGFSKEYNHKEVNDLLLSIEEKPTTSYEGEPYNNESFKQTYTRVGKRLGISSCGIIDENGEYHREFYFPYLDSDTISTNVECDVYKHSDKESYSGMCEEYKLGVSLIFYLQNGGEYKLVVEKSNGMLISKGAILAGLSVVGEILLPVKKTEKQAEQIRVDSMKRSRLFEAARQGSEVAIETLTMEDMDTFSKISNRVEKEDIYSIVDTSFLPFGVECDHYSIVGEITDIYIDKNKMTKEKVYILSLECNTLLFDVCINEKDLLGVPEIGRRFKGIIWMQGCACFGKNKL